MKNILKIAKITAAFSVLGGGAYAYVKVLESAEKSKKRLQSYYDVLNQWLSLRNEGKSVIDYFTKNNYKNIAIYGFGELGNRLWEELKDSSVNVVYFVDKDVESGDFYDCDLISPDEIASQKPVDVLVITPIHCFDEIERKIRKQFNNDIISIEDVVFLI